MNVFEVTITPQAESQLENIAHYIALLLKTLLMISSMQWKDCPITRRNIIPSMRSPGALRV